MTCARCNAELRRDERPEGYCDVCLRVTQLGRRLEREDDEYREPDPEAFEAREP